MKKLFYISNILTFCPKNENEDKFERYAFDDHHQDILDSANEINAILGAI
jgi:hypothetical protein